MGYTVRQATHVGRGHLLSFRNRQDAVKTYHSPDDLRVVAFICDGCSQGETSEVGASLAADFLVRRTSRLIENGVAIKELPKILYGDLIAFLRSLTSLYGFFGEQDMTGFVGGSLLFTVVGLVIDQSSAIVMMAGDGVFVENDNVKFVEQNNTPMYPAYHLLDKGVLPEGLKLPEGFEVFLLDREKLTHVAIGSDAWIPEEALLDEVWNASGKTGLQRKVNAWARQQHFGDDVSIVTVVVER